MRWASSRYEMLTGSPPFTGTGIAIMRAHTDQSPPPLRTTRPDIPETVDAAIIRMLAKKAEDRFPDLAAAIAALDAQPLGARARARRDVGARWRRGRRDEPRGNR